MSNLRFISNIIYGLKKEFGGKCVFRHTTYSSDLSTGTKSPSVTSFIISRGILLPVNTREQFLKSIGVLKMAYLEPGQSQFLIDKKDIPVHRNILINDTIEYNNQVFNINAISNYQKAYILTVNI